MPSNGSYLVVVHCIWNPKFDRGLHLENTYISEGRDKPYDAMVRACYENALIDDKKAYEKNTKTHNKHV